MTAAPRNRLGLTVLRHQFDDRTDMRKILDRLPTKRDLNILAAGVFVGAVSIALGVLLSLAGRP